MPLLLGSVLIAFCFIIKYTQGCVGVAQYLPLCELSAINFLDNVSDIADVTQQLSALRHIHFRKIPKKL